ncbi:MAG: hypothetical protein LBU23_12675, partial [Planctomycetota bacterium]|nr:hypothetical protein [Planctomycetota bacterium]
WEEDEDGHRVAILRNYAVVILPQLTITARNMVLNIELQEIYAEGDVLFDEPGGNAFYCDQLTFNYQEWRGLAKNIRVKMDRAGVDLPVRDFLDTAPSTSLGNSASSLNDASGSLKRMYVQARELRAHDSNTMELIDARITPDSFARPHWYFRSPAAIFRKKEKIEAYHNTVNVGRLPLLYFPYLIRDLQYDWPWMRMTGGQSSDYGYFIRTQWGWRLAERPGSPLKIDKIIFDLDLFSRRGAGAGVETTYKLGDLESLGKLKLYGVYEYAISEARDLKRALEQNEFRDAAHPGLYRKDFRWAVDWEHFQQLNDYWDVRAEAHLHHDRDYLRDYDPGRYWSAKEPENSIDLRRLDNNWELEFVASSRLSNKWQTKSEYYPEARLTIPGLRLGGLPLFLKDDLRVGVINRGFDEDEYRYTDALFRRDPTTGLAVSRLAGKDNYGSMFRVMNELTLEAPLKLGRLAVLKPWVGLRTGYYSDAMGTVDPAILGDLRANGKNSPYYNRPFSPGDLQARGSGGGYYAVPFGADLSTRTYSIFGASDQWRLISEPTLSYLENARPRLDSRRELYPVDVFDEYRRQRRFGVELHEKLQRRDYENAPGDKVPELNILDLNLALYHYPRARDRDEVNYGHRFSELSGDLIFRPTRRLSLSLSGDYDLHDTAFNRFLASADWRLGSMFRVSVAHYYYRGGNFLGFENAAPTSETHFALRTKLWNDSSHYSVEGAMAFEWRRSQPGVRHGFNKYRLTLYRDVDTFELAFSYVRDRNAGNHGFFFSLSPKSFMGYESPPPAFSAEVEPLASGRYPGAAGYLESGYRIDSPAADADLKDVQF